MNQDDGHQTDLVNSTEVMLRVRNVEVSYPGGSTPVLRGLDLSVPRGGTVGLIGRSGAGKSTLARTIMGLLPYAGRIEFGDRELSEWLADAPREYRRRVQLLLQNSGAALSPRRTVATTLAEALAVTGQSADGVKELLDLVGLPSSTADRLPHELSGGETQRVAIARALSVGPDLLILDEPLSSLDLVARLELMELLSEVQQLRGLTYLYVVHDLALVKRVCQRVAVMDSGIVVEEGETSDVLSRTQDPVTRDLIAANPGWSGV